MDTNLLDFVLPRLQARQPNWREVARGSGVPYDTVKKIATGVTRNPGVLHVQRLAGYYSERDAAPPPDNAPQASPSQTFDPQPGQSGRELAQEAG